MTAPLINVEALTVGISAMANPIPILRDISLEIMPGETLGLVGESGSGKSTVALAMMGYLSAGLCRVQGKVNFDGHSIFDIDSLGLQQLRGGEICLVPQNAGQSLTPTMTIGEQIEEALMLHTKLSSSERKKASLDLLNQVRLPHAEEIARRYPHALSGGQQQRCAIAMALAGEPRVLLLDEPTTGLDVTTQVHILDLLKELSLSRGVAMIFVSHDLGAVARISDKIAVLYSGELIEFGPKEIILSQPDHPYTRGLLDSIPRIEGGFIPQALKGYPPTLTALRNGCAFAPRCLHATDQCNDSSPALDSRAHNHQVRCHYNPDQLKVDSTKQPEPIHQISPHTQPLLEIENLAITYNKRSLISRLTRKSDSDQVLTVDNINFILHQGETIGVVGESGSGKSTILKSIVGLQPPCNGQIHLHHNSAKGDLSDQRTLETRKAIQMIFQNPDSALNPRKTICEIISAPLELYFDMGKTAARERVSELLEGVRLTSKYLDRLPGQLSGGEKQRVGIARAFAANPELVLCDEVTSALDVSVQAAVLALLSNLQKQNGVAYLFVSHDLSTVRAIADRVLVLYQGRICEIGSTEAVYTLPSHPYTEALMSAVLDPDPNVDASHHKVVYMIDVLESSPPAQGCAFQRRCQHKIGDVCETTTPPAQISNNGQTIFCHIPLDELEALQQTNDS